MQITRFFIKCVHHVILKRAPTNCEVSKLTRIYAFGRVLPLIISVRLCRQEGSVEVRLRGREAEALELTQGYLQLRRGWRWMGERGSLGKKFSHSHFV